MRAYAVIGANYGDEGKGLITDYLSDAVGAPVVVRANGGAQAGHTVCLHPLRHVFHHIGSGTFMGARTFLSRFFVCNPVLFNVEFDKLQSLSVLPRVIVDPHCFVTTPWDMLFNQSLENARGKDRHGSCGVGFNATIERCLQSALRTCVADLTMKASKLVSHCCLVRAYFLKQLTSLGLEPHPLFSDNDLLETWLADARLFLNRIRLGGQETLKDFNTIVFEGAQGLGLDMDNLADFPYLTRSNTGIKNPLEICEALGIKQLTAVYVTRSYCTRHGAGPLPHEALPLYCTVPQDATNVDHPFQGALRTAPLDVVAVAARIKKDLKQATTVSVDPLLAITHLDVTGPLAFMRNRDVTIMEWPQGFAHTLADLCGFQHASYLSFGPNRSAVVQFSDVSKKKEG